MPPERRKQALFACLAVVLGVALYTQWPGRARVDGSPANSRANVRRTAAGTEPSEAPDVHLEALDAEHPRPAVGERNLFRFRARPVAPVEPQRAEAPAALASSGPPPPPPLPPIPLKFIGLLQSEHAPRVAILSDGRGPIFGKEGDAVLGQYRILRIANESIEIAYLDGRGRQTIRLSGS